ncbi:hypothetical protein B0H17DRAFT_1144553 [Mycena rosella]|uniref:Uncharacterized protein n=1 Tax=Mycena rosella TaxID=1033263 RepID=A0AAD7CSY9_MYCRO|nr:hypothetical protein B0H17DRAFT_1144553 [Mycena rosella]
MYLTSGFEHVTKWLDLADYCRTTRGGHFQASAGGSMKAWKKGTKEGTLQVCIVTYTGAKYQSGQGTYKGEESESANPPPGIVGAGIIGVDGVSAAFVVELPLGAGGAETGVVSVVMLLTPVGASNTYPVIDSYTQPPGTALLFFLREMKRSSAG